MHPRERLDYSPIDRRPPLRFPQGVRLVVWPLIALEEWDLSRPMARMVISPPQGVPQLPDLPNWSWHEYGMRVGFWRLKKMLERLRISPTVTLNAKVCETYPYFGRITHAAARCKSIFDNAGIAAVVFERRARGWRDVRRAKLAEAGGRRFFFFRVVAAIPRCCMKAEAIIVMSALR